MSPELNAISRDPLERLRFMQASLDHLTDLVIVTDAGQDPEIIYVRSAGNPEFGNGDYIQINSFSITSQFIPSHRYVSG